MRLFNIAPTKVTALAGLCLLPTQQCAEAWSAPSTKPRTAPGAAPGLIPKQNTDAISTGRRNALQKIVAAGATFGILLNDVGDAQAAVMPTSEASDAAFYMNNGVYYPGNNSLDGKVILITGSSSGLGLESSKRLAAAGATVVMTARSEQKAEKAITEVQQYLANRDIANSNIYAITLNLADFDSIKSFPEKYEKLMGSAKIDVLMNNAGVAALPEKEMTKDGFEMTFQTNHLGPFMLTALLFPYLNREKSRVINVSSRAHDYATIVSTRKSGLDMDNLNGELEYSGLGWPAYCQSKLENILFTEELQKRADDAGLDWLSVTSLHPGAVATEIWRNGYFGVDKRGEKASSLQSIISNLFYSSIIPVEEGANTQVMLASFGEKGVSANGQYFDEHMQLKQLREFATDREKAQDLWKKSQELTGVEFIVK